MTAYIVKQRFPPDNRSTGCVHMMWDREENTVPYNVIPCHQINNCQGAGSLLPMMREQSRSADKLSLGSGLQTVLKEDGGYSKDWGGEPVV